MVAPEVGYAIGAAGLALAVLREWAAGRERRRARPVVVCNEHRRRHPHGSDWSASVFLTNESAASAFNIRFGIRLAGEADVAWKHDLGDEKPSRINVLRPGERSPGSGTADVIIPTPVLASLPSDRDPDDGRTYWAYYQSPAGDWWFTSNPVTRSDDLTITPVRSRRWGGFSRQHRDVARRIRDGEVVLKQAIGEVRTASREVEK